MSKNHSSHSCTLDLASHPSNPCAFDCTNGYTLNADATACVCAPPSTVDAQTSACVHNPPLNAGPTTDTCWNVDASLLTAYADATHDLDTLSALLCLRTMNRLDADCMEPLPDGCHCLADISSILQQLAGQWISTAETARTAEILGALVRQQGRIKMTLPTDN